MHGKVRVSLQRQYLVTAQLLLWLGPWPLHYCFPGGEGGAERGKYVRESCEGIRGGGVDQKEWGRE